MDTILLISNQKLDAPVGRAEKLTFRKNKLEELGWQIKICYIDVNAGKGPIPSLKYLIKCYREVENWNADIVHSISEPYQLHVIGAIVSHLTCTPWLAELRDPIASSPGLNPDGDYRRRFQRTFVEKITVTYADKVVWLDGIQIDDNYFERKYPQISKTQFKKIPGHGVDLEGKEEIKPVKHDQFTLIYAGSFYKGWIEPMRLLDGIKRYTDLYDPNIQIIFFGDWEENYTKYSEKLSINDLITVYGWQDPSEVQNHLAGADGLIYIGGTDNRNKLNIPSKIYDYLTVQVPILGLVDPSFESAKFITSNDAGTVVDPDKSDDIAEAINSIKSGSVPSVPDSTLTKYSRKDIVAEFDNIFRDLIYQN
jgi:hypothetical protein